MPEGTRGSGASSGGLSDAGFDDGRFAPGVLLGDRYRIVGLLGRGGMGEVYRADDLKLGRVVALKFLPEAMERDPGRLARFLNEVRTAVRVTHPNVCRVHDIGEVGGRHYLSMEYVDGEDLASLLRRVGRLPGDRAVRVARQLCAGLTAAHKQGVLHRDLKPANVMIDGRGEVKITDFGLAGAIGGFEGDEIRVGTPAYMAPEQVAGREVDVRSDLYALGLVLYELFSGKPAFAERTPEAIARRAETPVPSLTTAVDDVDPAVARIVERCLSSDPHDRPGSAMAVAAALPGGDPLAAVLEAGETPSPELIAEAGASGGLRPRTAVALLVAVVVMMAAVGWLTSRVLFAGRVGLDRSPAVLIDRAEEIVRDVGWSEGLGDRNHDIIPNWSYYSEVRTRDTDPARWDALADPRRAAALFVYRASRGELQRTSEGSIGNWIGDPPPLHAGMVEVQLDPTGRLRAFRGTPEYFDVRDGSEGERGAAADFGVLFAAANIDPDVLRETEPAVRPRTFADRRYAWEIVRDATPADAGDVETDTDVPAGPARIEASSIRGRPLSFVLVDPWDVPEADSAEADRPFWDTASDVLESIWFVVALIGAAIVAARNIRLGRGDHRTALRFGLYLAGVRLVWLLASHPGGDPVGTLTAHLAWSAYRLSVSYVFYMALEPYARRLWPEMLVSWVRAFAGRLRDARVGRDLLIGVAVGCGMALAPAFAQWAGMMLDPSHDGLDNAIWSWESLRGVRSGLVAVPGIHVTAVLDNFNGIMLFLVLRVVLGSTRVAVAATTALAVVLFNPGQIASVTYLVPFAVIVGLFWWSLFRAGLLTVLVAFSVQALLSQVRVTADVGAWHALPMWLAYGTVFAVGLWGFRATLAGRPLFRDEIQAGPTHRG